MNCEATPAPHRQGDATTPRGIESPTISGGPIVQRQLPTWLKAAAWGLLCGCLVLASTAQAEAQRG